jgi:hypothetical protein
LNLREIVLQPVAAHEEGRFQALMETHHYLGALAKIAHTLRYVATWNGEWLALLSFWGDQRGIRGQGRISRPVRRPLNAARGSTALTLTPPFL